LENETDFVENNVCLDITIPLLWAFCYSFWSPCCGWSSREILGHCSWTRA